MLWSRTSRSDVLLPRQNAKLARVGDIHSSRATLGCTTSETHIGRVLTPCSKRQMPPSGACIVRCKPQPDKDLKKSGRIRQWPQSNAFQASHTKAICFRTSGLSMNS